MRTDMRRLRFTAAVLAVLLLLAAGAAIILLLALSGLFGTSSRKQDTASVGVSDLAEYERGLEKRLTEILSQIGGVGEASVMVTLDTSEQTEYGKNADMLLSVTAPRVRGVIVVCDGGNSVSVKQKVVEAVTGVFGISSLRISVAGSQ